MNCNTGIGLLGCCSHHFLVLLLSCRTSCKHFFFFLSLTNNFYTFGPEMMYA